MWMSAAPIRMKVLFSKRDDSIRVVEDHSVDPLAPIEIKIKPPKTRLESELASWTFNLLKQAEFKRQWTAKHKIAHILEREMLDNLTQNENQPAGDLSHADKEKSNSEKSMRENI